MLMNRVGLSTVDLHFTLRKIRPIDSWLESRPLRQNWRFRCCFLDLKMRFRRSGLQTGRKLLLAHIDFFRIKVLWFGFGLDVRRVHSGGRADLRFASGTANVLSSRQVLGCTWTMRSRWLPALDSLSRQRSFVICYSLRA
jgi:hypothetical protein